MVVENVLRVDQTLPSYQCRTAVVLISYWQSWTDKDRELRPRSDGFATIMTDRGGLLWSGTSAKNDRHSVTWALRGDNLGLNIVLRSFVMQHWILIIPLFVYMLNLWLLMQNPIITHIVLEQGTWCCLLIGAWYIVLSLISQYHSLDPNNHYISRVHCIESIVQGCGISSAPAVSGDTTILHWAIETATLVAMPYIHSILQDWYLQCISNGDTTFLH